MIIGDLNPMLEILSFLSSRCNSILYSLHIIHDKKPDALNYRVGELRKKVCLGFFVNFLSWSINLIVLRYLCVCWFDRFFNDFMKDLMEYIYIYTHHKNSSDKDALRWMTMHETNGLGNDPKRHWSIIISIGYDCNGVVIN